MTSPEHLSTTCCIAGGGPAGMMLGFLLARSGVEVTVIEKHSDFLRDFRGDTIHPSTLELMHELGILDEFLKRPHQEVTRLAGQVGNDLVPLADFSYLPTRCKFIAFMPQWDFLNFLVEQATKCPSFKLLMDTEVEDLIQQNGHVCGVVATSASGRVEISADLTIGADGRHSVVRDRSGLRVKELGAPIDVLWFRLPRKDSDPGQVLGRFNAGKIMVMLNRGDYWQCGFVIPKGDFETLKNRGLESFYQDVVSVASFLSDRIVDFPGWDEVKLLTVAVDRLSTWYCEGLLCIGDAAHAMSPVGGVGINLAIQDAVAASNFLSRKLLEKRVTVADLKRVQQRRLLPTRIIQAVQVFVQNRVLRPALENRRRTAAPFVLKLFRYLPFLQRFPAYMVGIGVRPEHIRT